MRLNHVTLLISDFERSKAFYKTLGLTQIVDAPPRYARFTLPEGDETLSIEVKESPGDAGRAEIFIECASVDETVAALKGRGITFDEEPADMPYLWRVATLRDPDGHVLRFYTDTTGARLNPPWKVRE